MNRSSMTLTTLLPLMSALLTAPACGSKTEAPASDKSAANVLPTANVDPPPAAAPVDPWQEKLAQRVLADSGLGVGGKLSAFDIVNCESGDTYCQVCKFGSSPKIMAVGSSDDADFHKDLQDLDAIVKKYGDDKLKVFAVITEMQDGKAKTPVENVEELKTKAQKLKTDLGLSMPVVVPAPIEQGPNKTWDEYYNITKSGTVMFADGKNTVEYSAVAPSDFAALDQAIKKVLSEPTQQG